MQACTAEGPEACRPDWIVLRLGAMHPPEHKWTMHPILRPPPHTFPLPPRRNLPPAPTPGLLALDLQSIRLPLTAEIVRQIPQIVSVFRPRPFEGLGFETSLYRGRLSLGQPGEAAGIGLLGNEHLGRRGNGLFGNALIGH